MNAVLGWLTFVQKEITARRKFNGDLSFFSTCLRLLEMFAHWGEHRQVVAAIKGACTRSILDTYPRVIYRYTLPYLSRNFPRQVRAQILKDHYAYLNTELSGRFFTRILDDALTLWTHVDGANSYSISLAGPCPDREGELTLRFKMDDCPLYRMAFSVMGASLLNERGNSPVIYVGQVQGCKVEFGLIRQATKTCSDVAPPDLLMAALFGVAAALNIKVVAGVAFENCLTFDKLVKLEKSFNMSDFWEKYKSFKNECGHHVLNLPFIDKPLSEVKANHRGRTLVKRAFKKHIAESCAATMAPLVVRRSGVVPDNGFSSHCPN